ncbi:hypothetical protein A1O1_01158 [Capronia coronata CBS 617.96]|uniref:Uncharacterized protein n=1 Tax=Capronia coronata CBS 617.96 TaxID=1182541 RepID=W9YT06_9EURO|nr:uncharacterized protein A1O1_01158 [Capronia coronata CBS 617.96]EXJ96032.1 hypothetical protein A1O1_01158 [Capronia coronata CBS 617.96]
MPTDKQPKTHPSKPLTPALSSNFRHVRPPLTPRVLGSAHSSPTLSTRREPFVRSKSPGKSDQPTTPLNVNITPRSGARLSRIGTESPSTPVSLKDANNGAPSSGGARKEALKPGTGQSQGLGISTAKTMASAGTPVVTVHRRISATKSMVESDKGTSAKFFHANDAKSSVGSPSMDGGPRFPPGRGYFFVDSPTLLNSEAGLSLTGPNTASEDTNRDDKFFRADDIPQHAAPKPSTLPQISTTGAGSRPAISKGYPQEVENRSDHPSPPQSPNRIRRPLVATPSSPRKLQPGQNTSPPAPPRPTPDRPKSAAGSSVSPVSSHQGGHRKSISSASLNGAPVRRMSGQQTERPQPLELRLAPSGSPRIATTLLSSDIVSPRSASLASTNTVPTSITSDVDCSETTKSMIASASASNTAADQAISPNQPQNDDAANARRDRKVLDLEISNSSLLAINKTLERELRKQSGELRRYRRLSRSGRLSLASTTRTASGQSAYSLDTVAELDGEEPGLSDLEPESDMDDLDDEDESLVSNDSSSFASPTSRARQRARDEKRLLLDLSKHQQILLDSQKLSQSIKRCLTCTEELIRDGNRALDYKVGIGDVKLGGRVLHDEELDERGFEHGAGEQGGRQGLLSPGLAKANLDMAQDLVDPIGLPTSESKGLALLQEITDKMDPAVDGREAD